MKYKQAGAGEEKNIRERDWVLNVWEGKTESSWEVYDKTRGIIDEDQKRAVSTLLKNYPILWVFLKLVLRTCTLLKVTWNFMGGISAWVHLYCHSELPRVVSHNFHLWPMDFFTTYIPNNLYLIIHCPVLFQCVYWKVLPFPIKV